MNRISNVTEKASTAHLPGTSPQRWTKHRPVRAVSRLAERQIRLFQPGNQTSNVVDLIQPGGLVARFVVASNQRQPTSIVTGSEIEVAKQLGAVQILERRGFSHRN